MLENTEGAIKMDNPERLATYGRQSEENKITTQYVLDTTIHKQTQIMSTRDEPSYKQPVVKTNLTSFLCENRNGHHITKLRTQRHIIKQHTRLKQNTICAMQISLLLHHRVCTTRRLRCLNVTLVILGVTDICFDKHPCCKHHKSI